MNKTTNITWEQIFQSLTRFDQPNITIYGVPKGGMIATAFLTRAKVTHDPIKADVILDDLIDSGRTQEIYKKRFPNTKFVCLYNKQKMKDSSWIVFPWEKNHPEGMDSIQDNIVRQIQYIGEDPEREGLKETPNRIVRSWDELFAGYAQSPDKLFTTFNSDGCDQIVLLKNIELFSMCEHHLLPFFGKAHIAYIPSKRVIGISKLARLLEVFARRMQIQERIGEQVTDTLMRYLRPQGAACIIEAVHMCMRMRGIAKQQSTMITSSLKGVFIEDTSAGRAARQELMRLVK